MICVYFNKRDDWKITHEGLFIYGCPMVNWFKCVADKNSYFCNKCHSKFL